MNVTTCLSVDCRHVGSRDALPCDLFGVCNLTVADASNALTALNRSRAFLGERVHCRTTVLGYLEQGNSVTHPNFTGIDT